MLADSFKTFVAGLCVDNFEDIDGRFKRITKRLNDAFWGIDSNVDHSYMVGSVGRETAISGVSDLDMLFVLPKDLKQQYDQHDGNGQSKLLQRVKAEIKKTYPHTIVRGDGQVVVVSLESVSYTIEVCPAFERTDGAFDYPDSNHSGSWKKTDPLPEIAESKRQNAESGGAFKDLCALLRAWKNHGGFKFGGLLIDTLVCNFLSAYPKYKNAKYEDYLQVVTDLFYFLKTRKKDQKHWFALGSNQKVYNQKGTFVSRASTAYNKLSEVDENSDNLYDVLRSVFGRVFPAPVVIRDSLTAKSMSFSEGTNVRQTEEFIRDRFPVDIRFNLRIDCEVKQNGFRTHLLRTMIRDRMPLLANKSLRFSVVENEFEELAQKYAEELPFEIYWKVLNRGSEAVKRDCIRGQIVRDKGKQEKIESTDFKGDHLVECYLVYNGTVVARDRVRVPISTTK